MRRLERLELSLGSKNQLSGNRSFHWLSCKPAQYYHSKWQVQSLDMYEPVIRDLATRKKIVKYMEEKEEEARDGGTPIPTPKSTPKQIRKLIMPKDLERMSAFHLFLDDNSSFVPQTQPGFDLPSGTYLEKLTLSLDKSVCHI